MSDKVEPYSTPSYQHPTLLDVLGKIDQVRQNDEIPPSLVEQMFSSDARDRAKQIGRLRSAATDARSELISGLKKEISMYLSIHRKDLELRGQGWIGETSHELIERLTTIFHDGADRLVDKYEERIAKIAGRSSAPELKKELLQDAKTDLQDDRKRNKAVLNTVLDAIESNIKLVESTPGR